MNWGPEIDVQAASLVTGWWVTASVGRCGSDSSLRHDLVVLVGDDPATARASGRIHRQHPHAAGIEDRLVALVADEDVTERIVVAPRVVVIAAGGHPVGILFAIPSRSWRAN